MLVYIPTGLCRVDFVSRLLLKGRINKKYIFLSVTIEICLSFCYLCVSKICINVLFYIHVYSNQNVILIGHNHIVF